MASAVREAGSTVDEHHQPGVGRHLEGLVLELHVTDGRVVIALGSAPVLHDILIGPQVT